MRAEIIAIGSELVSGQSLDTNSQWLSQSLAALGIPVHFHTGLGDDLAENVAAFRLAIGRADLVVCTGGLGPTQDDLTREALAAVAGVELVEHAESLAWIESFFTRRNRVMTGRNRVQALFPAGADVLPNAIGTAPGIGLKVGDCRFACLPGVPREMKRMFEAEVVPRLRALGLATRAIVHRKINLFGKGESEVEAQAMDLTARDRAPQVGITASETTISFRVSAEGATAEEARAATESTVALILDRFGDLYVGEGTSDVADATVAELIRAGRTIAVVEAGTGGLIAQLLAAVPGHAPHFLGSLMTPAIPQASRFLGAVDATGEVGPETASGLAVLALDRFGADLALAAIGHLEAGPGVAADQVGMVHLALATADGVDCRGLNLGSEQPREVLAKRAAKQAINFARLHLKRTP